MIDNMTQSAFQLKGSAYTLTVLLLLSSDIAAITDQLRNTVKQNPRFFQNTPIILDLQKIAKTDCHIDFTMLCNRLKLHSLIPVGVCGATPLQQQEAIAAGLAVLTSTKVAQPSKSETTKTNSSSKLVTKPVRSGQQIYAKDGDLIILNSVSAGAELLADGNIHVYGALRGRALAGINGNTNARIFCKTLAAELISIAGHYWVSENLQDSQRENVQFFLENDHLQIADL